MLKLNSNRNFGRRSSRGFSLIDFSLYSALAVIGVVALFALFREGSDGAKEQQLVSDVNQIVNSLQRQYANSPDYNPGTGTDLVPSLIASGAVPAKAINGTAINTPYGGTITVESATSHADFLITINDVPTEACFYFVETFLGMMGTPPGVRQVVFNTGTPIGTNTNTFPIDRAELNTGCNTTAGDANISITYD